MFIENLAVVVRIQLADESVLHHSFLEFDISIIENLFEDILVCSIDLSFTILLHLVVSCPQDGFEEHGVVETVFNVQTVLQGQSNQLVKRFKYAQGLIV